MDRRDVRGFYGPNLRAVDMPKLMFQVILRDGDASAIRLRDERPSHRQWRGGAATGAEVPGITIPSFDGASVAGRVSQTDMPGLPVRVSAVPAPA